MQVPISSISINISISGDSSSYYVSRVYDKGLTLSILLVLESVLLGSGSDRRRSSSTNRSISGSSSSSSSTDKIQYQR